MSSFAFAIIYTPFYDCTNASVCLAIASSSFVGIAIKVTLLPSFEGDIDPAICDFICQKEHLSPAEMNNILNKKLLYTFHSIHKAVHKGTLSLAWSGEKRYQIQRPLVHSALCERIGIDGSLLTHQPAGKDKVKIETPMPNHTVAVKLVIEALTNTGEKRYQIQRPLVHSA